MGYIRSNVQRMRGYVPGEQSRAADLIKLNTNENPYPPAPGVLEALRTALDGRLRLYPDPSAAALRQRLGARYGFDPGQIVVGNGCDDILTLCVRAFCGEGDKLAWFWPSYSLYPVLAEIQGAVPVEVPLTGDYRIDLEAARWSGIREAPLLFITQPNAPSGVALDQDAVRQVIEIARGVVVIDEAYADFADTDCRDLARACPNVLVARSFSKSFALAGLRIGWAAGSAELIGALAKVKDSYNVNQLSQVAAAAALEDSGYFTQTITKIRATRARATEALSRRGFVLYPSQANFVFARPPPPLTARVWWEKLRQRNVLVRWWDADRLREFARISIGTDDDLTRFLDATDAILSEARDPGNDRDTSTAPKAFGSSSG